MARARSVQKQTYSIPEFCAAHGISRGYFYEMRKRGIGPKEMRAGGRVMISREAAAAWRRECEAA